MEFRPMRRKRQELPKLESMEEILHGLRLLGCKYNPGDHAGLQHEIDKSVAVTLHQQRVLFLHIAEIVILRLCCR